MMELKLNLPLKLNELNPFTFNLQFFLCGPKYLLINLPCPQHIADTWPNSLDDSAARRDWGWKHEYDLDAMTQDMLDALLPLYSKPAASGAAGKQ